MAVPPSTRSLFENAGLVKALVTHLEDPQNLEKFLAAFPTLDRQRVIGLVDMAKRCSCMKD